MVFYFNIIFSFIILVIFSSILFSSFSPLEFFNIMLVSFSSKLANIMGLNNYRPVSTFFCSILFFFLIIILVGGFLPYSFIFIVSPNLVFFLSLSCWITSFLYLISTETFSSLVINNEFSFFLASFLFFIEIIGIFINPFSLGIRLYLNIIFGFYILLFFSLFLVNLSICLYFFVLPLIFFEFCVFLVQSFVFTYLVSIYFEE